MTSHVLPLDLLPEQLHTDIDCQWQRICESQGDDFENWFEQQCQQFANLPRQLLTVLAGSQYVVDWWVRQPDWLRQLISQPALYDADAAVDVNAALAELLPVAEDGLVDEVALHRGLRVMRQQQMIRIIFRDLNRIVPMEQTTLDVSLLAEASIDGALSALYPRLCKELGTPMSRPGADGSPGQPQTMVIIGMGKLGAHELNLSSDIDLIFAYPEAGETTGARRTLDNRQFFMRLGQRLIKALDTLDVDGFVFRVDMRLRPYGQSGALVLSFDAMEEYYQDQGRDWERYAMIKARIVGGSRERGSELMETLRPFTYRRYIDFSAIESLRSMKEMIHREVMRRGKQNDIKLGAGGIREIEFIAQAFQLIRGGRETDLQERSLQKVLSLLADKAFMPEEAVAELQAAYVFLRNTEHAIQAFQDRQTQQLPDDESQQARLAFVMGFADWAAFMATLDVHREQVHHHFKQIIAPAEEPEEGEHLRCEAGSWWHDGWEQEAVAEYLEGLQFEQAGESARLLVSLRDSNQLQGLQKEGRERLDRFIPLLLCAATESAMPSRTLERILPLLESVLRRSSYLVLLIENPKALQQLVVLCEASPWIAEQLARHPVLLDELLDVATLYQIPEKDELYSELRQQLLRISPEDLEGQMEALRYFKLAHGLRVAAAEVTGRLPLMRVSDYLTAMAEVILAHVLDLAWEQMIGRHGCPARLDGVPCERDFIIIGYGKSGGIEMGHGSDLDLVFIHDADPNGMTDGKKTIANSVFFTRLGQRIIHIMNTQTRLGKLYEVDMRLRPSGNSGLLVSSLKAFTDYQNKQAWTWEHQALVRARVLAGSSELTERFLDVRRDILCQARELPDLRQDVREMRRKMVDHLAPKSTGDDKEAVFHLKHSPGGIVDIEFVVQYAVLAWASQFTELTHYTDNIRLLETLEQVDLLSADWASSLIDAYKTYRSQSHRLTLQRLSHEVSRLAYEQEYQAVDAVWQHWLGESD